MLSPKISPAPKTCSFLSKLPQIFRAHRPLPKPWYSQQPGEMKLPWLPVPSLTYCSLNTEHSLVKTAEIPNWLPCLKRRMLLKPVLHGTWHSLWNEKQKMSQRQQRVPFPLLHHWHTHCWRRNSGLMFVFLSYSGLTMGTHSSLSWHTCYCFTVSLFFLIVLFSLS